MLSKRDLSNQKKYLSSNYESLQKMDWYEKEQEVRIVRKQDKIPLIKG